MTEALSGKTVAGDVVALVAALPAGSRFEVAQLAVQRAVGSAVAASAEQRVQQIADRGQAAVAVQAGEELRVERGERCKAESSGAQVREPSSLVVAQREHRHLSPAVLQESCPGSTKGRPGSHSSIEFVRT